HRTTQRRRPLPGRAGGKPAERGSRDGERHHAQGHLRQPAVLPRYESLDEDGKTGRTQNDQHGRDRREIDFRSFDRPTGGLLGEYTEHHWVASCAGVFTSTADIVASTDGVTVSNIGFG